MQINMRQLHFIIAMNVLSYLDLDALNLNEDSASHPITSLMQSFQFYSLN
jgi:hypothetical protein